MARTRALLTETEREQLAGAHGDQRRYEAAARVRSRIRDELGDDVAVLQEHHSELLGELREVVLDVDERGAVETVDESRPAPTSSPAPEPAAREDNSSGAEEPARVDVATLDLPGQGDTLERRQEAVRDAYDYLRSEGEATTGELRERAWSEHQTGYASERSMWKNCVYKGLAEVARRDPNVLPPGEGGRTWAYDGS